MMMKRALVAAVFACLAVSALAAQVGSFSKVQVADKIRKVEDGVDEFKKWAEKRGEQGKDGAEAAKASGRTRSRTGTEAPKTATESQKEVARERKDELEDALGDLDKSTNRLRRKFDPTDKWQETRPQVENVMEEARKINQVLARGKAKYGSQAEKYWAVLRNNINDLARAYGVTPLGV